MIAPVCIAGLELYGFFSAQAKRGLQLQAHAHMDIGDLIKCWSQFAGLADVGHITAFSHAKLCVVHRKDASLADLLGPPAQMREPILDSARRQTFALPAIQQRLDVVALE